MQLCIASTSNDHHRGASLHGVIMKTRNAIILQLYRYILYSLPDRVLFARTYSKMAIKVNPFHEVKVQNAFLLGISAPLGRHPIATFGL